MSKTDHNNWLDVIEEVREAVKEVWRWPTEEDTSIFIAEEVSELLKAVFKEYRKDAGYARSRHSDDSDPIMLEMGQAFVMLGTFICQKRRSCSGPYSSVNDEWEETELSINALLRKPTSASYPDKIINLAVSANMEAAILANSICNGSGYDWITPVYMLTNTLVIMAHNLDIDHFQSIDLYLKQVLQKYGTS